MSASSTSGQLWPSPSEWPQFNHAADADGRLRFLVSWTPSELERIQAALMIGLREFSTQDYGAVLDPFIRETNAVHSQEQTMIPIGVVLPYAVPDNAVNPVPSGWMRCDGQLLLRVDYPALFSAIGVIYGSTDANNFAVPNLSGRVVVGSGAAPGLGIEPRSGNTGGAARHTLTVAEIPPHTHGIPLVNNASGANSIARGLSTTVAITLPTNPSGGGLSHNNMQPYLVLQYIIRAL